MERLQGTLLEECWKPAFARYLVPRYTGLRRDLERYLVYYNFDRAHTGRWTQVSTTVSNCTKTTAKIAHSVGTSLGRQDLLSGAAPAACRALPGLGGE